MASEPWHRRAGRRLRHSLKARLVALFLVLALALAGTFLFGMQKALSLGWQGAARPLLADYVDRLVDEIGSPPSQARAQALVQRLPITVSIQGPTLRWRSHPDDDEGARHPRWRDDWRREAGLFSRDTADGHRIQFGLDVRPWRDRPRYVGWATLAMLLLLTLLAYKVVRRLLQPLDDIREGANRFGQGHFDQPIPVRRRDELGDLAADVNAMASGIHQMLEAKRALLLAISHELRSPLTRARLNTELLPERGEAGARREALLRDLQEMADLVTDLLEGERLGQGHAALHREVTDLATLAREALAGKDVRLEIDDGLPELALDPTRMRLLLRNLTDNALQHGSAAGQPPLVRLACGSGRETVVLTVRDYGAGAAESALPHLAEPFWRADSARGRESGGVGLGLYLCRLVAQAHGGTLHICNAHPGLRVQVELPA